MVSLGPTPRYGDTEEMKLRKRLVEIEKDLQDLRIDIQHVIAIIKTADTPAEGFDQLIDALVKHDADLRLWKT